MDLVRNLLRKSPNPAAPAPASFSDHGGGFSSADLDDAPAPRVVFRSSRGDGTPPGGNGDLVRGSSGLVQGGDAQTRGELHRRGEPPPPAAEPGSTPRLSYEGAGRAADGTNQGSNQARRRAIGKGGSRDSPEQSVRISKVRPSLNCGGRFWALTGEDSDIELSSDGEAGSDLEPLQASFGDALNIATDLRGAKPRKQIRKEKLREIEARLEANRNRMIRTINKGNTAVPDAYRHRKKAEHPVVVPNREVDDDSNGTWFNIFNGKAVRRNLDPFVESARAAGVCLLPVLLRPPAGSSLQQANTRPFRLPGDDVNCFAGIKISIRTLGRVNVTAAHKAQPVAHDALSGLGLEKGKESLPSDKVIDPDLSQVELILQHWWEGAQRTRVRIEEKVDSTRSSAMGERFGGGGGRVFYERNGERDFAYNSQRPPFPAGNHQRPPFFRGGNYQGQFYGNRNQGQNNYRGYQYSRRDTPQEENFKNSSNSQGNSSQPAQKTYQEKQQAGGNTNSKLSVTGAQGTQKGAAVISDPPSEGTQSVVQKTPSGGADNLYCNKCSQKGHITRDCKEEVECINCGKAHLSSKCIWLRQKKPTAALVGFGGPGLACFVAEHAKETASEEKGKTVAIVKVKKGSSIEVNEELLEECLGKTYPWKWEWQAKKISSHAYLVNFPSVGRINEVSIYDWVTLKGAHIKINVKQWSDESLAAGKLDTVWVQAKRVPKVLKNYHGLCEVGSALGQVVEVDMESLKKNGSVRMLIGVVDHRKIPPMAKITTKKLLVFYIYFQLEQVVEEGWSRPEEEYMQNFDEMEDSLSQDFNERKLKKQKQAEEDPAANVRASEDTKKALEEREKALKAQNEMDANNLAEQRRIQEEKKTGGPKNTTQMMNAERAQATMKEMEGGGDTEKQEYHDPMDTHDSDERVDLSGNDRGEGTNSDSSVSFSTKLKEIQAGKTLKKNGVLGVLDEVEENNNNRFSARLATKQDSDVPILDKEKKYKLGRTTWMEVKQEARDRLTYFAKLMETVAKEVFGARRSWASWTPRLTL